ncbi:MAG TPA: tetratricopeptide repeat protein [Terracidiphilus sp.]|jgi:tetratricopeptide (TPR) repeat protein|nr:tetratricopeptide repeat protein [Terracidiphilus sp.]
MMIRSLIALFVCALAATAANAQAHHPSIPSPERGQQNNYSIPDKPELLRRVAVYEAAAHNAVNAHASAESLVKIYANLGALYMDLTMYPKGEDAMKHAILLLKDGPKDVLAEEIGHLSVLHSAMGEVKQAEKDQMRALAIREAIGDPLGIALTWSDMAELYFRERQMKKALDYAQRAFPVLAGNTSVSAADRIAVKQTLAVVLCEVRQCARAISIMKDALELAKSTYGEDSLAAGIEKFLLGHVYWRNGDEPDAAEWMKRGIERMKVDLGWGHAIYLNSMREYAVFLRRSGQVEEAASAQSEVRRAESIVDARSFTH